VFLCIKPDFSPSDTALVDSNLCDSTYIYYVEGIDSAMNYVSSSNLDTAHPLYPPATGPKLRVATVAGEKIIHIFWNKSNLPGIKYYIIDKWTQKTGWIINYLTDTDRSYNDTNVNPNADLYKYRLRSVDRCGVVSPYGNTAQNIILSGAVKNDRRYFNWTKYAVWTAGIKNYVIQIKMPDSGKWQTISPTFDSATGTWNNDSIYMNIDTFTCFRVLALEDTTATAKDTSASNTVCVLLASRIWVPNAFTPDNDSLNDVFKLVSVSLYNMIVNNQVVFDFQVYNRWGTKVFETNDYSKGWDGTFNGKKCTPDEYFWVVDAHGLDGAHIYQSGTVTMLR